MVPSALRRLIRAQSQSSSKFFPQFCRSLPQFPHLGLTQFTESAVALPVSDRSKPEFSKPDQFISGHIYPSFSLGFFLNPILPTSTIRSEIDGEVVVDDSVVIRADSVKKKRKRKMNKHKLKKLRKRLRRKT